MAFRTFAELLGFEHSLHGQFTISFSIPRWNPSGWQCFRTLYAGNDVRMANGKHLRHIILIHLIQWEQWEKTTQLNSWSFKFSELVRLGTEPLCVACWQKIYWQCPQWWYGSGSIWVFGQFQTPQLVEKEYTLYCREFIHVYGILNTFLILCSWGLHGEYMVIIIGYCRNPYSATIVKRCQRASLGICILWSAQLPLGGSAVLVSQCSKKPACLIWKAKRFSCFVKPINIH